MKTFHILLAVTVFALLSMSIPLESHGQDRVSGVVFNDQNHNGERDAGEAGVASVAVSNGRDVVLTDEAGRYELSVDDDDIVFVIKPSGYNLPVDDRFLPEFYYIHKPAGSPELDYRGVEPTGALPDTINFPVVRSEEPSNFKTLLFGDPQPYTREEVDYFDRDIVSEVAGIRGYDFGISLGDLVGDDLDLFDPYTRSVSRIGIPWFNVYGNHDMNFDAGSDQFADETFEATFGPATYAFNHGEVHFIILDDVIYPRTDGENGYIGGLTEEQFVFLENDLEHVPTDRLVVVAFHIPIFLPNGRPTFRLEDRERMFELLSPFQHTLSLSAHTHLQRIEFFDEDDGWKRENPHIHYNVGTTSGDWWSGVPDDRGIPPALMRDGTPNGYAAISFEGSQFIFDYKVADADSSYRMNVWGPDTVPRLSSSEANLYVNYFLGNDSTIVDFRAQAGGNQWSRMDKVNEPDPNVSLLVQEWNSADSLGRGRRPSNPAPSTHIWEAVLPDNLPVGTHTVEIRITDMFDREFFETFTYEIVEPRGETEE